MVEIAVAERALELDNVRAGYGETVVLEEIRLALGASETVSIIGRNGVGKTTLLATIMGHTTLHGGRIALHGKDISRLATYRRVTAGLAMCRRSVRFFLRCRCVKTSRSPHGRDRGQSKQCLIFFRVWRSVPTIAAISCRAASSRCWRSAVR